MDKEDFVEQNGEKFRIIDLKKYVTDNKDRVQIGSKVATVTAVRGKVGEQVITTVKSGKETVNYVSYDTKTGLADWVVTQASGEKQIVTDASFKDLYEYTEDMDTTGTIKPNGKNRPLIPFDENVAFVAPWGGLQYIRKGGYAIVVGQNDMYGIQKEEFEGSYTWVEKTKEESSRIFDEAYNKVGSTLNKPKIFLSVAYPYNNEKDMSFLKEVLNHINDKGIECVNIRGVHSDNENLIQNINSSLKGCEGMIILAFDKGGKRTSPYIQMEGALGSALNVPMLSFVSEGIRKEGVVSTFNNDNLHFMYEGSLYGESNKHILKSIDIFLQQISERYKFKLTDKVLFNFQEGLRNPRIKRETKQNLNQFLKNFYGVDEKFDLKDVYVKRPVEIKAQMIEKDGIYKTKEGDKLLKKGDFLVMDIDGSASPYNVSKDEFEARYVRVNGKENVFVPKLVPTVARDKGDSIEVFSLLNSNDKYSMDVDRFDCAYMKLEDYVLNIAPSKENNDEVELNALNVPKQRMIYETANITKGLEAPISVEEMEPPVVPQVMPDEKSKEC